MAALQLQLCEVIIQEYFLLPEAFAAAEESMLGLIICTASGEYYEFLVTLA